MINNICSPLISIIVPVYKIESYISRCLDSILRQTFSKWECILVDDGSPDRSGDICEKYARYDSRFKVFHKKNGGVSSARNLGIDKAQGIYITFIDGDDFIDSNFLEELYTPCLKAECIDFVHAGCVTYNEDGSILPNQAYRNYIGEDKILIFNEFRGLVFSKLFLTDVIKKNNIRFDELMHYGEDMVFTLDYLMYSKRYALVDNVGYFYVQRPGSAMNTSIVYNYERELHAFQHRYDSVNRYISKFNVLIPDAKFRLMQTADSLYTALYSLYMSNLSYMKLYKIYKKDIKQEYLMLSSYSSVFLNKICMSLYRHAGFMLGDCFMRGLKWIISLKNSKRN